MMTKELGPAAPEPTLAEKLEATERELEAMRKIEEALRPLTPEEQRRVIGAICILYQIELEPLQPRLLRIANPSPPPIRTSRWMWRGQRRKPYRCRACNAVGHNKRSPRCPLNFSITVENE